MEFQGEMGARDTLLGVFMGRKIQSKRVSRERTAAAPGLSPGTLQPSRDQENEKELAKEKEKASLISWKPSEMMTLLPNASDRSVLLEAEKEPKNLVLSK